VPVEQFAYGWVTPILAYVMSFVGCLLGFMITKQARWRTGTRRARLLGYASLAFGGTGVWLMNMVALLGLEVPATKIVYDPIALAISLGLAVVDVGVGLMIAATGRRLWLRRFVAAPIIALGAVATQYLTMSAVRVNGEITYGRQPFAITAGIAVVLASVAVWAASGVRRLRFCGLAAALIAASLTTMHYFASGSMRITPDESRLAYPAGMSPLMLLTPVILVGAVVLAMLAFFAIGNASAYELRSMTAPSPNRVDPKLIEEVTERVTSGAPVWTVRIGNPPSGAIAGSRPVRPRPVIGTSPSTMPSWRGDTAWVASRPPESRPLNTRPEPPAPVSSGQSGTVYTSPSVPPSVTQPDGVVLTRDLPRRTPTEQRPRNERQ
jgi:NO-binding membrane sensor protein with MHYT domain